MRGEGRTLVCSYQSVPAGREGGGKLMVSGDHKTILFFIDV